MCYGIYAFSIAFTGITKGYPLNTEHKESKSSGSFSSKVVKFVKGHPYGVISTSALALLLVKPNILSKLCWWRTEPHQLTIQKNPHIFFSNTNQQRSEATPIWQKIGSILRQSLDENYVSSPSSVDLVGTESQSLLNDGAKFIQAMLENNLESKLFKSYHDAQKIIAAHQNNQPIDKSDDQREETRKTLLQIICKITLFYYFCSTAPRVIKDRSGITIIKELGFVEGTFHITEPSFGKLITCYQQLIEAYGHQLGKPNGNHWFGSNEYAYWRASTHKEFPQGLGIEISPKRDGFDAPLLGKFEHLLCYVNPDTGETWLKLERKGCYGIKNAIIHFKHAVQAATWRFVATKFEIVDNRDDLPEQNEELVPYFLAREFTALFPDQKSGTKIGNIYAHTIRWLREKRNLISTPPFTQRLDFAVLIEILYDYISIRTGNEVIITPEKLERELLYFDNKTHPLHQHLRQLFLQMKLLKLGKYSIIIQQLNPHHQNNTNSDKSEEQLYAEAVRLMDGELEKIQETCTCTKNNGENKAANGKTLQKIINECVALRLQKPTYWENSHNLFAHQTINFTSASALRAKK